MSRYIKNMVWFDGAIIRLPVRKAVGDTYITHRQRVQLAARRMSCSYFALCIDRKWSIYSTAEIGGGRLMLRDVKLAAAEMWLMYREMARG